jgi:transcriptional regulator NrdR family protein
MTIVTKRNGKSEVFNEKKVTKSIIKSCVSSGLSMQNSKKISEDSLQLLLVWLSPKTEVTTNDIRHRVSLILLKQSHDAGYIYKYHRIMD